MPWLHTWPHAPQLAGSVRTFRHVPWQHACPAVHACPQLPQSVPVPSVVHTPPQHACPGAHTCPQPPQLRTSLKGWQKFGRAAWMALVTKVGGRRIRSPPAASPGARRVTPDAGTGGTRHHGSGAVAVHWHCPFTIAVQH
jgi:hypothetical protein